MPRVAVVGHVEWVTFAHVERLPEPGEIVHAEDVRDEAGGGGGVAAVQLARLTGDCVFLTALGDDDAGRAALERLRALGVTVHAARRPRTRRAFTHTDARGERTITVLGERIVPHGDDPLPWHVLNDVDAVYFTGGDAEAARAARRAGVMVATPRAVDALSAARVRLDALVYSRNDPQEVAWARALAGLPVRHTVATDGERGGRWTGADRSTGDWAAAEVPGPIVDAYGCGDSFACGLTVGLGRGEGIAQALRLAARCGAACLAGRGPYGFDLRALA